MKPHQKHAKLTKSAIGSFGRNEFAFVGAPCSDIQALTKALIKRLVSTKRVAYIDADHASADSTPHGLLHTNYTDKITFQQIDYQHINEFQRRSLLNSEDVILVNGNHFEAASQLVCIHPKKEASLKKRIEQLSNVRAIIIYDDTPVFDWLKASIPKIENIPVFRASEVNKIYAFLVNECPSPKLKGLVLAGGKSTRMGHDKGLINYHGKPQREHLFGVLESFEIETFLSCRAEQETDILQPKITDKFIGLGPFGAILSAFQHDPNAAWLVLACDLPFTNENAVNQLVTNRNTSKLATAFFNSETNFPDPLFTIYEPKAYAAMLQFLALGYSCPRKVLINSDTHIVQPSNNNFLRNINTLEEKASLTFL